MKNNKIVFYILGGAAILMVLIGVVSSLRHAPVAPNRSAFKHEAAPQFFSQLDGMAVTSSDAVVPQVLGIMIDNHPDARPQYGLGQASIVYEAPAEGGITRYFAIFDASKNVTKAGPVRSARPYFIDWIREYGAAPYLHSGGSPKALAILATDDAVWDANEFSRGQYFWRGKESFAPHNLFTSSSLWTGLIARYKPYFATTSWEGWRFDVAHSIEPLAASTSSVSIAYANDYTAGWKYNSTIGRYLRYINGEQVFDPSGKPIVADNVLVQKVKMKTIDDYGRKEIETVGSGAAIILYKGYVIEGTWEKGAQSKRTIFRDVDSHEVNLTPGVTWVEVVPSEIAVDY